MIERGAQEPEVTKAMYAGEKVPAKSGRQVFRKNFQYDDLCGDRTYSIKQVLAIVAEEPDVMIVVTVYTFYF